jgi:hypothetical protein
MNSQIHKTQRPPAYRERKFACKKCPKVYRSQQSLDKHNRHVIPCDFKCRKCDFLGVSKSDMKLHMAEGLHIMPNTLPAINDMTYENVVQKVRFITETKPDGTVTRTTEVINNHTLAAAGGRQIQAQLQDNTLMRALGALAASTNDPRLRSESAQLLYHVHDRIPFRPSPNDEEQPGRKVWVLERGAPNASATWIELPRELGVDRLAKHASDMYAFLIECGVQRLQSSTFQNQYVAQSLMGTEQALVVTLRQHKEIHTQFSDIKDLTECPLDRMKEAEELMEAIQTRKMEIIDKIKHMLDDDDDLVAVCEDIERFIRLTKPRETPNRIKVLDII